MKKCVFFILFISFSLSLFISTQAFATEINDSTSYSFGIPSDQATNPSTLTTPDNLYHYSIANNEVTIVKYLGSEEMVIIPEQIDGLTVTTIGKEAFQDNTFIKSISLSNVKTIANFAFNGCYSLISVSGSNVNTIGIAAFQFCTNLQVVEMKNTTTLDACAFLNCRNLVRISMPNVTKLNQSVFGNCDKLAEIDMPNVTIISDSALQNCKGLKTINMMNIREIGYAAFANTGITNLDLKFVNSLGSYAFQGCTSLQSVNFPSVTKTGYGTFEMSSVKTVSLPSLEILGYRTFNYTVLDNLTLSDHLITIYDNTFQNSIVKNLTIYYGNQDISSITVQDFDLYVSQLSALNVGAITGKYVKNDIWFKDLLNPDTEAPVMTLIGDNPIIIPVGSSYIDQGVTVVDNSGQVITPTVTSNLDTTTIGTYTILYSATDVSGNKAELTRTVQVIPTYTYSGLLQPINKDGSSVFKANSTIPVKFQLKDVNGQYASSVIATLSYKKVSNTIEGTINEATSTSAATSGNLFRYDSTCNQYIYNFSTKGLSAGKYEFIVTLDNGQTFTDGHITLK